MYAKTENYLPLDGFLPKDLTSVALKVIIPKKNITKWPSRVMVYSAKQNDLGR